jgi:hypothetical protein
VNVPPVSIATRRLIGASSTFYPLCGYIIHFVPC